MCEIASPSSFSVEHAHARDRPSLSGPIVNASHLISAVKVVLISFWFQRHAAELTM